MAWEAAEAGLTWPKASALMSKDCVQSFNLLALKLFGFALLSFFIILASLSLNSLGGHQNLNLQTSIFFSRFNLR